MPSKPRWFLLLIAGFVAVAVESFLVPPPHARRSPPRDLSATSDQSDEARDDKDVGRSVSFCGGTMELTWHDSIGDIPASQWDACCLARSGNHSSKSPFLEHAWLHSLEESGCASAETGWIPRHLSIRIVGEEEDVLTGNNETATSTTIDGCVPVYLKTHSMGEFIFDSSWAEAAYRNGIEYFPKLLVGVPFTPVSGPRILWHSRVLETFPLEYLDGAVGSFLKQTALGHNWSTVHINFCTDQEATVLSSYEGQECELYPDEPDSAISNNNRNEIDNDDTDRIRQRLQALLLRHLRRNNTDTFLRRTSLQYHWQNRHPLQSGRPFTDFEDYLSCFRSKRRINIRRERTLARQGQQLYPRQDDDDSNCRPIRIDAIVGADILQVEGLVEQMFEIYRSTVDKLYWGRQYLTLEFFQRLCQSSFIHNLCFLCARYDDDVNGSTGTVSWDAKDVFAGTFNVVKDGVFYGRYWGCLPGHDIKNLHFETCYWAAIEYCIQNCLLRMEPGAGGGDYKWARGFDPQVIHSVHYVCNPWLRQAIFHFIESETEYHLSLRHELLDRSSVAERENLKSAT